MSERKTYVILGLGRFGSTLAEQLTNSNQDVIAIDKSMQAVDRVSSFVANALCLDYTDIDALIAAGVKDADVGIVTTGTMLDQEIQGIINLKELGIPYVLAKAKSMKIQNVLKKVGADETVSPEYDMAKRTAKKLISKGILDLFELDSENSVFEIKVPSHWINHNLKQLKLRERFKANVIALKRNGKLIVNVNPDDNFLDNDEVLLFGPNELLNHFDDIDV